MTFSPSLRDSLRERHSIAIQLQSAGLLSTLIFMISAIYEVLAINHLHESQHVLIAVLLICLSLWAFLEVSLIRHHPEGINRLGLLRWLLAIQIGVVVGRHWRDFTSAATHTGHQAPIYRSLEFSHAVLSLPVSLVLFLSISRCLLDLFAAAERLRIHQLQQQMALVRKAQEDLEASEIRYRNFFNLSLVGTAIISDRQEWIAVNDETCRILGYSRQELTSRTWCELTHPDDLDAEMQQYQRMCNQQIDGYQIEKRFLRKDGSIVHTLMAGGLGPSHAAGQAGPFHMHLIDISDRKRVEAKLTATQQREQSLAKQQRRMLEQKLKTSLTASAVVHEIQQPLATILLNCRLAEDTLQQLPGDAIPPALRHQLNQLTLNGEQVTTTMERMRMLLRNVETQHSPLNLATHIESALLYLQRDLRQGAIQLNSLGLEDPCPLLGDGAQLQSAAVNLIRNAIEAMQQQPPDQRHLRVELHHQDEHIEIQVSDSGPGFPDNYSGNSSWELLKSTKSSGMGIGLFLAQTAATNHGGHLRIERSESLGGAMVVIQLPRYQPKL